MLTGVKGPVLSSLFDCAEVMPFPHGRQAYSSSREIILAMKSLITRFVRSVSRHHDCKN